VFFDYANQSGDGVEVSFKDEGKTVSGHAGMCADFILPVGEYGIVRYREHVCDHGDGSLVTSEPPACGIDEEDVHGAGRSLCCLWLYW